MARDSVPRLDTDDLWLLTQLRYARQFSGLAGICDPSIFSKRSRAFYRRRLYRLEKLGLVRRSRMSRHTNGDPPYDVVWTRTTSGKEALSA
jgi:hypothetical protein